jgi:hypothetical protein
VRFVVADRAPRDVALRLIEDDDLEVRARARDRMAEPGA